MTKSKRIIMAEALERAVNLKIANEGENVDTQEIREQINMSKIHRARTERAKKNIVANEKLTAGFGGTYTQAEKNMLDDLHPGVSECLNDKPVEQPDLDIIDMLDFLTIFNRAIQDEGG